MKILQRLSHSSLHPDSLERLRNGAGELALCKYSYCKSWRSEFKSLAFFHEKLGLAVYACKPNNTEQKENKQIQRTAWLKYHTSCSMRDLSQDNREESDREIEAFTGLSVCALVYAHTCISPLKEKWKTNAHGWRNNCKCLQPGFHISQNREEQRYRVL